MTITAYPFQTRSILTQEEWASMMACLGGDGIDKRYLNKCVVAPGSGRQVTVASGRGVVKGMFFENGASVALAVTANGSGNSRHDLVVVEVDFSSQVCQFKMVDGTPAGSPTVPALTQSATVWQIPLARVIIANGFSTISGGDITDFRPWARTNVRQSTAAGGSDTTTSTASYVTVSGASITMYTGGGDVVVTFGGDLSNSGAGGVEFIGLRVDSAGEIFIGQAQSDSANQVVPFERSYVFTGLAAGFHVFDARWKVGSGTGTVDNSRYLRAEEKP